MAARAPAVYFGVFEWCMHPVYVLYDNYDHNFAWMPDERFFLLCACRGTDVWGND
jgi:hypothetical protein